MIAYLDSRGPIFTTQYCLDTSYFQGRTKSGRGEVGGGVPKLGRGPGAAEAAGGMQGP